MTQGLYSGHVQHASHQNNVPPSMRDDIIGRFHHFIKYPLKKGKEYLTSEHLADDREREEENSYSWFDESPACRWLHTWTPVRSRQSNLLLCRITYFVFFPLLYEFSTLTRMSFAHAHTPSPLQSGLTHFHSWHCCSSRPMISFTFVMITG